ncbi:hypothetical phage protein [Campylobacter phage CP220]|uniref:Hypothetical phage protein n=1 Tax=Campylobacter phage CP220 TaxID=2994044 RepID=D5GV56_9CAUD|nr:hypothetical protein APL47_gp064 [Campylobacter phage CP220]CBJ93873.1 hypothetical phage protein [Campylobacter phage CP220]
MVKASGVAIVPDGIEFSEETNEFWDEITNKFLEEYPTKYSKQERMNFLRACGIRVDLECDNENKERFAMDVKKLKESLEGKDQGKYFCEIFNNNVDILVIDGGMKKHEAIVQVLEDVKILYKND